MISRVRPSLNGAREALKTWDEARVIWPRIKVCWLNFFKKIIILSLNSSWSIFNQKIIIWQSVLSMEEIQPFSEKPIDRSIALAIYNGTFVWHTAAAKAKANKMSLYEFRNFSILLLLFHLLLSLFLYSVGIASAAVVATPIRRRKSSRRPFRRNRFLFSSALISSCLRYIPPRLFLIN